MKNILLACFLAAQSILCLSQAVTPKALKDSIIWREGYKLVKEDYKAKPKPNYPIQSSIAMYMYVKDAGGKIVFVVETIFLKSMSYMKAPTDYLLKHEQVNFDLCELYARKLRKKIADKNFAKSKNIQKELTELYNDANKDYYKEREKYEKESEVGLNMVKQQAWADRVAKELAELSAYASTEVEVKSK